MVRVRHVQACRSGLSAEACSVTMRDMARLTLVRHAQASFDKDDYDQLSELGKLQASALGAHWVRESRSFDRAFVGPLRRHRETSEIVARTYASAGESFPTPSVVFQLDEHPGQEIVRDEVARGGLSEAPQARDFTQRTEWSPRSKRAYWSFFQRTTRSWASGSLDAPGHESWDSFQRRILKGINIMADPTVESHEVVAFVSGGTVCIALLAALGLEPSSAMELSWLTRNASYSEFLFARKRFTLLSHNAVAHLHEEGMQTNI